MIKRREYLKLLLAGLGSTLPGISLWAAGDVVFQAIGEGETLEAAKSQALTMLSQQILSEVSSSVSQSVVETNGQVSRKASVKREVQTHLLLKGVKYQVLAHSSQYARVRAEMDESAVEQTIRYLQAQTSFRPESLRLSDVPALKEKVRMLQAILLALPQPLQKRFQLELKLAQQKYEWLNKRENQALWVLNLQGKHARVLIDRKAVDPQQPIFLPSGRHDYFLEAKGFKPVEGVLQVRAGQRIEQTIDWVPDRSAQPVVLEVASPLPLKTQVDWDALLEGMGLQQVAQAPLHLKIKVEDRVYRVEDFERHELFLSMAFYRGQRRLKRLRTRFEVTTYAGEQRAVMAAVKRKLEQALRVLVSKTPL